MRDLETLQNRDSDSAGFGGSESGVWAARQIAVGDRLPPAFFQTMTDSGPIKLSVADVFFDKRVVLFGVPGAFTPTCHHIHLPSFIADADTFKTQGIDTIACTAVNDVFVLDGWAKSCNAQDVILFLADWNAAFARATGLAFDATALGLGLRSKRYAMVVVDGIVRSLNIEPNPRYAEISCAMPILRAIDHLFRP